MARVSAIGALLLLMLSPPILPVAAAATPPPPFAYRQLDNPAREAAAQELMETLRCLTCQSQSIADSDAPMAGSMRHEVRTRIAAGEDPEAIRNWLIQRYGDYVSYSPQVGAATWPLYAGPIVLLLIAGLLIRHRLGEKR